MRTCGGGPRPAALPSPMNGSEPKIGTDGAAGGVVSRTMRRRGRKSEKVRGGGETATLAPEVAKNRRMRGELEQAVVRWLLTDAGWLAVEVEDSCALQAACTVGTARATWTRRASTGPRTTAVTPSGGAVVAPGWQEPSRPSAPTDRLHAHPPASCHVSPPPDSCADEAAARGVGESGACGRRRLGVARHRHAGRPTSCGG